MYFSCWFFAIWPFVMQTKAMKLIVNESIIHIYLCLMYRLDFEFLTAAIMKIYISWVTMSCSPLKVNRRFGGTYCLHLQFRRVSQARNQRESGWKAEQSSTLHGVISQKIELYIQKFREYINVLTSV
jgi:hypothetical protein